MTLLGNFITLRREAMGLSAKDVLAKMSVPPSYTFLSRVENGKSRCSIKFLFKLAPILNIVPRDLFDMWKADYLKEYEKKLDQKRYRFLQEKGINE